MHAYNPEAYRPALLDTWIGISARQAPKDEILIPKLVRSFKPGKVLELGSGTGAIARLIAKHGFKVVPSDYAQFFVDHMRSQGLDAKRVDATDIAAAGLGKFENIFCHSISPFITDDMTVVRLAYESVLKALQPGGTFVMLHAMSKRRDLVATIREHWRIASEVGFKDVAVRRDQLLPSIAYAKAAWLAAPLDDMLAPRLGMRFILTGRKG